MSPSIKQHKVAILAIILVSYIMIVLDISIVITGLPKIRADLGFSSTALSWVQNTYLLAFGGLLLLGARAGDILGRKRMFITGLVIFTASSLVVGLAPDVFWLLFGRALQGVGAAILAPATLALLSTNFEEGHERTKAIGYYGASAGVSSSVGLVVGGIFAGWLSWRVGFFINLPIGIALIYFAARYLKETEKKSGRFDVLGALSSTVGMTLLVYGIVRAATEGWTETTTMCALVAGAILLAAFVGVEWKAKQPIMPLRLLTNSERNAALVARMLFVGATVGYWFFATQLMQNVMGMSSFATGFAFLPTTIANFITALYVPKLTKRFGNPLIMAAGLLVSVIGMALLTSSYSGTQYITGLALPMLLIGIGQGGSHSPLTIAGVAGVAAEDAGAASGLVNTAHQVGGSLGLGILVTVFASATPHNLAPTEQLIHRINISFMAASLMLTIAFVLVLLCIVRPYFAQRSTAPIADCKS